MPTINTRLLEFVACPDCGSDLCETGEALICSKCGTSFRISEGIPLLYPSALDQTHVDEEEHLAEMMRQTNMTPRQLFVQSQWKTAHAELWSRVADEVSARPGAIVNLGCGYYPWIRHIDQTQNACISLDIIYDMVSTLKRDAGAECCVTGDITALPFRSDSFDYVVCGDVIHHLGNDAPHVLASIMDILKPGGTLFLQDPNAWGLFQFTKSILLPKPVHGLLRKVYHKIKRSQSKPADYEFSTSVWKVAKWLRNEGFSDLHFYPHESYPNVGQSSYRLYKLLGRAEYIRTYHSYHYTIRAKKG